jgi:hypothetical protein
MSTFSVKRKYFVNWSLNMWSLSYIKCSKMSRGRRKEIMDFFKRTAPEEFGSNNRPSGLSPATWYWTQQE